MAGWKASKYYQNAARKVVGQHLWILLIFEALPKRTRLWTESVTVKCERITMNQAVQGIFPGCTGIQTRPLELRVTRRLDRRCKDGDSTDELRGKWVIHELFHIKCNWMALYNLWRQHEIVTWNWHVALQMGMQVTRENVVSIHYIHCVWFLKENKNKKTTRKLSALAFLFTCILWSVGKHLWSIIKP